MFTSAYPLLDEEMEEKRYSLLKLLEKTNLKYGTMLPKLKRGRGITIEEGLQIRDALESERTVEVLFSKVG